MEAATAPKDKSTMIELHDVWRLYRMGGETINALAGIDLKVSEGEFVTIVGPSGSGKSTLLNISEASIHPPSGESKSMGRT